MSIRFLVKLPNRKKHLRLKGLRKKTSQAYWRAILRIGDNFDKRIHQLSKLHLLENLSNLLNTHSWSAVKLDLYGLIFFYTHVLHKVWEQVNLIQPPIAPRLPELGP
ncbi:phage integrase N-terminal SAM-like domain-containing protein [Candidatus Scalindua japonica]|uniref:phage integrase N-terminal SAM-like domain-containing protein n=1 Tax=Candidatus Scalindua japonica TaxID=1284222 RepID=UPI00193D2D5D|nr:phage integrase N-terminal SAM-like domain-containing protein [Candidatus Scalindua japonica]